MRKETAVVLLSSEPTASQKRDSYALAARPNHRPEIGNTNSLSVTSFSTYSFISLQANSCLLIYRIFEGFTENNPLFVSDIRNSKHHSLFMIDSILQGCSLNKIGNCCPHSVPSTVPLEVDSLGEAVTPLTGDGTECDVP